MPDVSEPHISEQLMAWSVSLADSVEPTRIESITDPGAVTVGRSVHEHGGRRWLAVAASGAIVAGGVAAALSVGGGDDPRIGPGSSPNDSGVSVIASPAPPTSEPVSVPLSSAPTANPTDPEGSESTPSRPTEPETSEPTPSEPAAKMPPASVSSDPLADWPAPPTDALSADRVATLLPTLDLPGDGLPLRGSFDGDSGASPFTQIFVDAPYDVVVTLQTVPGGVDSTPVDLRQPLTIDGWDDAFLTDNLTNFGEVRLVASDAGGFVSLVATGMTPEAAIEIVSGMQRRAWGPGWVMPDGFKSLVEVNGAWDSPTPTRTVTWFDGTSVVAQMISSPASTYLIAQALGAQFEQIDLDGVPAWSTTSNDRRAVVWSPDGETIVVLGVVDDRVDPVEVARSVVPVDLATYELLTTTDVPPGLGDGCSGSLFC